MIMDRGPDSRAARAVPFGCPGNENYAAYRAESLLIGPMPHIPGVPAAGPSAPRPSRRPWLVYT